MEGNEMGMFWPPRAIEEPAGAAEVTGAAGAGAAEAGAV